ncbi:DoxX family protein [Methylocaldum sp.]|uniref:HvfX family Cu-binding RiPP maturation protein n=1 Tax=Methylocaldum sp. TaxID=1969727 RepID=UPI002D5EB417|nr:DoxX family protein [Methylocaldum sp.]HYE35690.1 DoxX family protein [Methylocaldum sp.]
MKDSPIHRALADSPKAASLSQGMRFMPPALRVLHEKITIRLDRWATTIPPLLLRLMLTYEFGEAGWMKLQGENWFADLAFPFPFSLLPPEANWWLATGFETVGAAALLLGLATRFFSFALMVLTVVAIASVHWPSEWSTLWDLLQGYSISDQGHGNYKLPVMYLIMFLPLLFDGAGTVSLDAWFAGQKPTSRSGDEACSIRIER